MKVTEIKHIAPSDEELMIAVLNGSSGAYAKIYDRYAKLMVNYFFKMLWQDREKAEDFMQELFTKIYHKPELYNPEKSFKTWIYTIANNMCKNEYRKHEIRKGTVNNLNENIKVATSDAAPDERHDKAVFNERLKQELEKLSETHRTTFILRFKHDLSLKEIAEITNTNEGTIKSRIFYALKKLSENLKEFKPVGISLFYLFINLLFC